MLCSNADRSSSPLSRKGVTTGAKIPRRLPAFTLMGLGSWLLALISLQNGVQSAAGLHAFHRGRARGWRLHMSALIHQVDTRFRRVRDRVLRALAEHAHLELEVGRLARRRHR